MNLYQNGDDESGLDDSHHEDERINERPLSAIRRKGLSNNEALLDILDKAEKDRLRIRQSLNKHKRIPDEEAESSYRRPTQEQLGGFTYTGPQAIQ